ncbi:Homeobox protein cut, partial [Stegodyphus mimosarum]
MEQAVDVVARSSLELELASKEKEISQLVDDIQRLQTILNTLQETSASKIAQLEELVNEKDKMIVELGEKLVRQQDYDEIKKELSILKSVEYNNSRTWEGSDENKNPNDKPPDLIKENNKSSHSEIKSVKSIKTEENGSSHNYPLQSVDSFGTMLGQEIVTNYAQNITKEEVTSRPSSPITKSTESYPLSSTTVSSSNAQEDRKPSPPALDEATSPPLQSAVNLTSERSSPSGNNHSLKDIASPVNDNSSLGKLQDCLRHNIDKYANETLNTLNIARCVRELLSVHNIGQRLFAKFVLGLSQGTVSELLSKPKPWDKLTEKGRDSYRKMHAWASDDQCIGMLKSLVPRRVAERRSTLLSSPPGKDCVGGSGGGVGLSAYKSDDQGAEERIAQILNEAQMAMMKQQEQKSPSSSLPNGSNGDNRSMDSCDDIRGDGNDSKHNLNSREATSNTDKSFRRSRKYENDDIPQEMVARIYQEELAKLIGQRVEEGFRTPRDQFERTQEEIRQALTIYHQELTRLSHLMPPNHHPNSFNPFTANGSSYNLSHHHNSNSNSAVNNSNTNCNSQPLQECPVDATVSSRSRSESKMTASGREEPEMRHHGSAFSLVRPKTETTLSSSMNSKSSTTTTTSYHLHTSSPAPPALLSLSESKTSSPGAPQSGSDDLATSASPLQRMQSITNSLLSQSSLPSLPNPPQRPAKAVLPPITQQQFDQYNNVNTEDIVKKVKEQLSQYSISQRLFGESVLGLSQGSVSDLLARPKPWHMLTQKGREPFIRMKIFLEDENAVHKLVASQYKIAPEKLMRTGSFGGATNPQGIMTFGSNKLSPRPMESNLRTTDNRQLTQNNTLYSSHNHPPRSVCGTPDSMPMSLTVTSSTTPSSTIHSRKTPTISRGYNQPSVYEMAALTTDLDTQIITSKIKETLMAHNIGQKIFGEVVLGLSQGSVSELLSKPKPWHMLSIKGREPFIRMQMWLNDPHNVEMLQTIKNERREANKRRRTGEGPMDSPRSQSEGGQLYNNYSFAPPSPYPPAKKPRVLFTEEQKEALRLAFSLDPYPSTATIEFLASELNLSVRTITNWFHNHRMRMKQHSSSDDEHGRKGTDLSLPPPVREGMAFDPVQYRMLLNQRLAEKCREKGGPQFVSHFGGSMPYLYSPYRNCSPLSSSGDDVGTLDLSMSSQLRNAINSGAKADTTGGSSTDDRSNSEMNDDSNLSQDNLTQGDNSDRESVEDSQPPHPQSSSPLRPSAGSESTRPTTGVVSSGSSNRRKPAMPQWVDPGLELSPENTDDEEDLDDDDQLGDESATEQEEIINGVCVRQTEDFDLLLPSRVETVHVLPVPAPDDRSSSKCHPPRSDNSRRTTVASPERSDNEMEGLTNGMNDSETSEQCTKDKLLSVNMMDGTTLKKPVFLEEQDDDESWDDAEAKDRRKNIEKLQQRLEKEDVGEDWEF